jgi:hypothetical protein
MQSVMSAEQPQNQRRQSYRFAVSDPAQGELVLADRSRWPVRLLDQSAGGFAVLIDSSTPVGRGDVIQLQTDAFCSEVRVVYTIEIELADGTGNASASAPRFRLGLMRLGDLAIPPDEHEHGRRWTSWHVSLPAANRSPISTFLGAILVLGTIFFGILFCTRSSQSPAVHFPTDQLQPAGQSLSKQNALPH